MIMCQKSIENFLKRMHWFDIPLLKLAVFFFSLFLVAAWPGFAQLLFRIGWPWLLLIALVFTGLLCKHVFLGTCKERKANKKKGAKR